MKISTPRNWHPYSVSDMFHGNRASRYEIVARKFRPSVAFGWQYFLQTATISTADAQRWRVVGTSVAGIKAAAIGRIFDILEGQYEVSSPGRPDRVNPENVKNVPLSISILPVSSDDIPTQTLPSWCCNTFPAIANWHWWRSRANRSAWRNFDEVLCTQAVPHLDNYPLQEQPCSCTMEPCTPHTAKTNDLLRREAVEDLDRPSRSFDLNAIENL